MVYVTVLEFGVDLETHEKIAAAVADVPATGMIVHTAGPTDEATTRVIDVWESKEDADRWQRAAMPIVMGMGLASPPARFQDFDQPFVIRA